MLCSVWGMADERKQLIIDAMERSVVHQDSAITQLLDRKVNGSNDIQTAQGYRVQVYSSNRGQEAKNEATELEQQLAKSCSVAVYLQYIPPFWKIRLGDFLTQEEASAYKAIFVQEHPALTGDTYIVRDQVNVLPGGMSYKL